MKAVQREQVEHDGIFFLANSRHVHLFSKCVGFFLLRSNKEVKNKLRKKNAESTGEMKMWGNRGGKADEKRERMGPAFYQAPFLLF